MDFQPTLFQSIRKWGRWSKLPLNWQRLSSPPSVRDENT